MTRLPAGQPLKLRYEHNEVGVIPAWTLRDGCIFAEHHLDGLIPGMVVEIMVGDQILSGLVVRGDGAKTCIKLEA